MKNFRYAPFPLFALALSLVLACAKDRPAASKHHALNTGGLAGLAKAADDIARIEIFRLDGSARMDTLPSSAADSLKRLVRGGNPIDARTLAHPPWPVVILFRTRGDATYAVTLAGVRNLRLVQDDPTDKAEVPGNPPDSGAAEMELDDERLWLWHYLESTLGPTREKEYLRRAPRPEP